MKPAEVTRTTVEVEVLVDGKKLTFGATGKEIRFPGFLAAYVEDVDDPEAALEGMERILPELKQGQEVDLLKLDAARHETKPPARFTEASLIKALEGLGIGRPSTYASIMSVIVDRGYVRRRAKELVPTFVAFMAMEVLDRHFAEFMDLGFTAQMDETLDEVASGEEDSKKYLRRFFLGGDGQVGLKDAVQERRLKIPFPSYEIGREPETGEPILIRIGKKGDPFLQLGDAAQKKFANVPDDVAPAELNLEKALDLFRAKKPEAEVLGVHPDNGRRLLLKNSNGFYLEVEPTDGEKKRVFVSLPPGADPHTLSREDLDALCRLPREIGINPETEEPVLYRIAKYGPVLQCGTEYRNLEDWKAGLAMSLDQALEILKTPKEEARKRSFGPIREFGKLDGADGEVKVMSGRFGPYVTDGTTNATLPKGTDPTSLSPEVAVELLQKKRAAGPSNGKRKFVRRKAAVKGRK